MKDLAVRSLREEERKRFFEFARSLPDRDFWGKKGHFLRGDFHRLQGFFEYIKPFQPSCFLVAEEDDKFVGFAVAVYNPEWVNELIERYGYAVDKRAYILGVACVDRRKAILKRLTDELVNCFHASEVKSVEYPTLGNVCLTTSTDVLTSENVDALMMFREAGFKISECYYSMRLELENHIDSVGYPLQEGSFRLKERSIGIVQENEVLGNVRWDPIENEKTNIEISVKRACRRRGLGTMLMAGALHRLKIEGARVVELGVDGNNLAALKLYRKFGFKAYVTHFYIIRPC